MTGEAVSRFNSAQITSQLRLQLSHSYVFHVVTLLNVVVPKSPAVAREASPPPICYSTQRRSIEKFKTFKPFNRCAQFTPPTPDHVRGRLSFLSRVPGGRMKQGNYLCVFAPFRENISYQTS